MYSTRSSTRNQPRINWEKHAHTSPGTFAFTTPSRQPKKTGFTARQKHLHFGETSPQLIIVVLRTLRERNLDVFLHFCERPSLLDIGSGNGRFLRGAAWALRDFLRDAKVVMAIGVEIDKQSFTSSVHTIDYRSIRDEKVHIGFVCCDFQLCHPCLLSNTRCFYLCDTCFESKVSTQAIKFLNDHVQQSTILITLSPVVWDRWVLSFCIEGMEAKPLFSWVRFSKTVNCGSRDFPRVYVYIFV